MKKTLFTGLTIIILCCFSKLIAQTTTTNLNPVKDNAIYSDNTSNSSGLGRLFSGRTASSVLRRTLMQFDLSSIPAGATITGVELTMNVDRVSGSAVTSIFNLHTVTTDWGEGASTPTGQGGSGIAAVAPDATWNDAMFGTAPWATAGGDFSPTPLTSLTFSTDTGNFIFMSTSNLVATAQSWLDTPVSNFGVILIGDETTDLTSRRFGSKDLGTAPTLAVTWCMNSSSTLPPVTVCDSFIAPSGTAYTMTGIFMDTIPNAIGCDSIITINLTVNNSPTRTIVESVCNVFISPAGNTLTETGIYIDTIPSGMSCDSIIIIDLTVNSTSSTIDTTVCEMYTAPGGNIHDTTESFTVIIDNSAGCDSIININLTVTNGASSFDTINEIACDSFVSPRGITYFVTNTYTEIIPNAVQCDSIITIDLIVNNSTASAFRDTACNIYTVPSGDTTYTVGGTYLDTIQNADGCSWALTIDVTILDSPTDTITESACNNYTAPSGAVYTESGTFLDTIPGALCDSIITINLTIDTIDINITTNPPSLTANAVGVNYQWLNCDSNFAPVNGETMQDFTPSINGDYALVVTENCTDTSECISIFNVGISENNLLDDINIYPNPNSGLVNVDLYGLSNVSITVFSISGQPVYHQSTINTPTHQFELNEAAGLYFIEISTLEGTRQYKLMKQ